MGKDNIPLKCKSWVFWRLGNELALRCRSLRHHSQREVDSLEMLQKYPWDYEKFKEGDYKKVQVFPCDTLRSIQRTQEKNLEQLHKISSLKAITFPDHVLIEHLPFVCVCITYH